MRKGLRRLAAALLGTLLALAPLGCMARQVTEEIKKYFGAKVFEVPAPRNIKLCESPSFGVPISQHAPKSRGGVAYQKIAEEFLRRMD